jgi:hypothetical protein
VTTPPELSAILNTACAAVGLQADDAEPIRLGENAIFRLPGKIIARIARPGQQAAARREVAVSRWLNASGVAAVATIGHIEQPAEAAGRSVTFWEELPPHQQGSLTQVASTLKRLHALPIPDDDRAWLRARLTELEQKWADAYGFDVTAWHGFALLRDIRELRMTCYAAQQAAAQERLKHEAQLRVDCLRGRRGPRPWPWTPAE